MNLTAEKVVEESVDKQDFEDVFPVYDEMDVSPLNWSRSKSTQKQALQTLSRGAAELTEGGVDDRFYEDLADRAALGDEEKVEVLGKVYRDLGYNRPKAAGLISHSTDFTYSTVYDKFTDHSVSFTFHGDEKREEAVKKLEEYSSEDYRKADALEEVSEEFDVPQGTLKNWLTGEGITFSDSVSAIVDKDSQRELIEVAEHYFDFSDPEGVEAMEKALGRKRDTLRAYKQGRIDTVPVELLENLESLFESEPMYRMGDPSRHVNDATSKTVDVENDFQKYLFSHLDGDEFEDITGKSSTTFSRYRNNKSSRIDREAYRKVFQAVSAMYNVKPEPEIEGFVERDSYAASSGDSEHARLDPEEVSDELSIEI